MQYRKFMVWFLVIPLSLVLMNCSQGSEGDTIYVCTDPTTHYTSASGPIGADLNGSYTMSSFDWDYYTAFGNYIKTITERDLQAASGVMVVSPGFADVSYSFVGTVSLARRWYLIFSDFTYPFSKGSVSWADSTSGTVVLDGWPSPFTASGDKLSINFPGWCFLLEVTDDPAPAGT